MKWTKVEYCPFFFFFFLRDSFNVWRPLLIIDLYYQIKTPISFLCKQGLNLRSLIQPSEILPIEQIETHKQIIGLDSRNFLFNTRHKQSFNSYIKLFKKKKTEFHLVEEFIVCMLVRMASQIEKPIYVVNSHFKL